MKPISRTRLIALQALVAVVALGYLVLPYYLITTGVYENWPAVSSAGEVGRLFLGTNALGIWDELFFVCTCFALLRRHPAVDEARDVAQALPAGPARDALVSLTDVVQVRTG